MSATIIVIREPSEFVLSGGRFLAFARATCRPAFGWRDALMVARAHRDLGHPVSVRESGVYRDAPRVFRGRR